MIHIGTEAPKNLFTYLGLLRILHDPGLTLVDRIVANCE